MKAYAEVQVLRHILLTSALGGNERSASHPDRFMSAIRALSTH
jgi:hypothetical protein